MSDSEPVFVTQDNKCYFSPRHVCQALGIDWMNQYRKIMADQVLASSIVEMTTEVQRSDTGNLTYRKTIMLPIEFLFTLGPSYFNDINTRRIVMSNTTTIVSDLVTIDSTRNVPMTTSLKVAEVFGKEHKNTIQAIELLDCSEEFRKLNFQLSSYTVPGNRRPYPMYLMTRDGFTFLAMGFNGARAAEFKERYIAEFNRMEAELQKSRMVVIPDFTNPVEAARAWADQYEKRQALAQQNAELAPKAQVYDAVVVTAHHLRCGNHNATSRESANSSCCEQSRVAPATSSSE